MHNCDNVIMGLELFVNKNTFYNCFFQKPWFNQASKVNENVEGFLENWIWWILQSMPFSHLVSLFKCYDM